MPETSKSLKIRRVGHCTAVGVSSSGVLNKQKWHPFLLNMVAIAMADTEYAFRGLISQEIFPFDKAVEDG